MHVVAVKTLRLAEFPHILLACVETDEGVTGVGDSFFAPGAIESYIHDIIAPHLLGKNPLDIQAHWTQLFDREAARFGGMGLEMRAISAVDVALWDILGQTAGLPIYQILGGASRDHVRTYNSSAGPRYGASGWIRGRESPGELEDMYRSLTDPGELAHELLAEGITAMKLWPFDSYAAANEGRWISTAELREGIQPVRKIREAVGDKMEIMIEGHGFWDLSTAQRIAHALEEFTPAWVEDLTPAYDVSVLKALTESTSIPVAASEYLITAHQYRPLLEQRCADVIIVDPTWSGGITETRRIATLSAVHGFPITMHDCTGPFTLLAGIHIAINAPNATYQESVRAYLRTWYAELADFVPAVVNGAFQAPDRPGLGAAILPDVWGRSDVTVRASQQ